MDKLIRRNRINMGYLWTAKIKMAILQRNGYYSNRYIIKLMIT